VIPCPGDGEGDTVGSVTVDLSILVCGLEDREAPRAALLAHLQAQVDKLKQPGRVEVLVEVDDGREPIGRKRNNLLDRAQGTYLAYVDDDDWVAPYYVHEILRLVTNNPGVDCLSFRGIITTDGKDPHYFEHSLACSEWCTRDGIYYRTPNHLNPVRRELALQVGFPPIDHGEDHDYSRKLYPLLKTHRVLPKVMYYYQFRSDKREPVVSPPRVLPVVSGSVPPPAQPPEDPGGTVASSALPFPVGPGPSPTRGPSGTPYPPPVHPTPSAASTPGGHLGTGSPFSATRRGRGRRKRTT